MSQPIDNSLVPEHEFKVTEQTISFRIGETIIPVKVFHYGEPGGIVCINLHDNENSSLEAAQELMMNQPGILLKIENHDQRVVKFRLRGVTYAFDPNRIFSKTGIEQTLRENRHYNPAAAFEIEKFAKSFLALIPEETNCVIALHNNTNEAYSVKSYLKGHERQHDALEVYRDSLQDPDDIVFTTDSIVYRRMADYGYNSILQDNEHVKQDGSLSVYFGGLGRRYVNVETEHGKKMQYAEMLGKLLNFLGEPQPVVIVEKTSSDTEAQKQ
jgi:hypothetical protein